MARNNDLTGDERREVAARLRFTDHNLTWSEGCFCIAEDVGVAPTGNEHDDVLAFAHALADLIEPEPERTCHIESTTYDELLDCFTTKLSCGCLITSGWSFFGKYCPECGARVAQH